MLKAEAERVAVIEKIKPTVVAVFARGGQGGGSGVLISDEGYALTNFHVVQPAGPTMQCGLADGVLYDAVLVGLDKVGDVALIKLLPKKEGAKFPFATMGDSDKVREGDWSMAMGNPFLLATDFTPTVTFGLVSGVHRYQYPAGTSSGIHRLHPDRHLDQSGQQRRAPLQPEGRADRHQRPRLVRQAGPGQFGRRLCHFDQPDQELSWPSAGGARHRSCHARSGGDARRGTRAAGPHGGDVDPGRLRRGPPRPGHR